MATKDKMAVMNSAKGYGKGPIKTPMPVRPGPKRPKPGQLAPNGYKPGPKRPKPGQLGPGYKRPGPGPKRPAPGKLGPGQILTAMGNFLGKRPNKGVSASGSNQRTEKMQKLQDRYKATPRNKGSMQKSGPNFKGVYNGAKRPVRPVQPRRGGR